MYPPGMMGMGMNPQIMQMLRQKLMQGQGTQKQHPNLMQGQNLSPKPQGSLSAMPNAPTFNPMMNPGLQPIYGPGMPGGETGMGHPGMDEPEGMDSSREEIMEGLRDRMRGMPFNRMPRPY